MEKLLYLSQHYMTYISWSMGGYNIATIFWCIQIYIWQRSASSNFLIEFHCLHLPTYFIKFINKLDGKKMSKRLYLDGGVLIISLL